MRLRFWATNRVILGLLALFILVGFWEFRWKPQYRPFYEQGVLLYQRGDYEGALQQLERAYEIAPNSVDVIVMMGWSNLKLRRMNEAEFYFHRAIRIDARTEEAQMGAGFVALETGRGTIDAAVLRRIMEGRGADPNLMILSAGAMQRQGEYFEAAAVYQELRNDRHYGHSARAALEEIFGIKGFNDAIPTELAPLDPPAETQLRFRAGEGSIWRQGKDGWERFYVAGVNLGPAAPGFYPGDPPNDGAMYSAWLRQADQMNANTLRLYTLLPPAFYRAYRHYKQGGGRMALYQQIWVGDPPGKDLYDPRFVEETKAEIRYAVDAMHGRGSVPWKNARGSGIFEHNIAEHVGALLLGRELEASVAIRTNILNVGKRGYEGRFVSVSDAHATEVWFAEMLDYLIAYQMDTYNWQHPVAIVNWPPLDPLHHPTEAPIAEEVRFRIRRGEPLAMPKDIEDDNDTVAIDEAKFTATADFKAGLFASYHVYPYYPDFLLNEPRYLRARDSQGPNPMFGYLRDLRERIPHPLVITEYGIPDSIGISHFHPYGWHHGGHTEQGQAEIVARLARTIREAECAGGIVFALVDEWYKQNWLTRPFQKPEERTALWVNKLDPEQRYGLLGYHSSKWNLFANDPAAWQKETTLYSTPPAARTADPFDGARRIERVQAAADEAFLYLRLKVGCLDCGGRGAKPGELRFDQASYAVALNTTPGITGIQQMPFGGLSLRHGANFLVVLGGPGNSRVLVADSYNPYQIMPRPGVPGETELSFRRSFTPTMQGTGTFEEQVIETNRRRFARDGRVFPAQRYSRSVMRQGSGKPSAPDHDSLAEWYADVARAEILVRIPWGKLYITDPSSKQAFYGFDEQVQVRTIPSSGVEITVFALRPHEDPQDLSAMEVTASFPSAAAGRIQDPVRFTWPVWHEVVQPEPYQKKVYYELQKKFREYQLHPPAAGNAVRAAGSPGSARASGR
jgi:tetratricopeptide (TPR) repeat protein